MGVVGSARETPKLEVAPLHLPGGVPGFGSEVEPSHLNDIFTVAPAALTPVDHGIRLVGRRSGDTVRSALATAPDERVRDRDPVFVGVIQPGV